jgi:general stress protein 26
MSERIAELDEPAVQRLLESAVLGRLGYLGPDGAPTVVPVGFLWNERRIVVCTATTAPKVSAIRRDPRVAIEIEGDNAEEIVLLRGEAVIDIVDGIPEEYLTASRKSMGSEDAEQFEIQVRAVYPQMARIAITPQWVRYYNFSSGRLPPFLQALVDDSAS